MEQIAIEKIIVKDNIRKDYGDLTELTASIKIQGMRKPIELNKDNELMDGYRRLKAAKAAGLKVIPFFYDDGSLARATTQMIAGIFQKNLNPIEEGKAFRTFMSETKTAIEGLATQISKKVNYIKKRLLLIDLPEDVQKALIEKRILMGHALLLAKLTKQDSSKFLKEITREKHSVERAREEITYHGFSEKIADANFDKSGCKHCQYNGSEQAELFETGTILNGTCMNPGCFHKKVKEFIENKKKKFKDVLFKGETDYDSPTGYTDGESEWECKDKGITEKYKEECKKDKSYLVRIRENGEITEYFKAPTKKGKTETKSLDETRKLKLFSRVSEYKREFLIKKSIELMQPGTKEAKVLTLIKLMRSANWDELDNKFDKLFKVRDVKKIYDLQEAEIDKAISYLSRKAFRLVDLKELIVVSRNFKVGMKKHFVITKEYLELYTKAQLVDLIEEFKFSVSADDPKVKTISSGDIKKSELIQHILNQNLKGKIPKILI